jgi:hypothetical protein
MTLLLDFILALVAVEAVFIVWLRYSRGQMHALPGDMSNLGAGFCLMLAVRLAWTNTSALSIIGLVMVAGAVHVVEMTRRFRRGELAKEKAPRFEAPATATEAKPPY